MVLDNSTAPIFLSDFPSTPTLAKKRPNNAISRKMSALNQTIFQNIHTNHLIYNTCWEDPRCDRELLALDAKSRVVMITSAGCNALDYALDNPAEIHCVDMNARQNALLDLKIAAIQQTDAHNLFKLFGTGAHEDVQGLYKSTLRPHLPHYARQYWDDNLHFFTPKGLRKSFYWHSTSGLVAWFFHKYFKMQGKSYRLAEQLFAAQSLEEQRIIYPKLEKAMMTPFIKWLMSQHFFMCLLGVPESQQKLLLHTGRAENNASKNQNTEGGNVAFIQRSLRHVFMELPIADNYFWQLYFKGHYTPDCCPNYLKAENNAILKAQTDKIHTHTTTITQFLEENPASYSHYVLLDHQDWLAANNRAALVEEWRTILKNSRRGTRILLRSAADEVDFFPNFVLESVVFEKEKTAQTHQIDRVGTYGSVYLGIVK